MKRALLLVALALILGGCGDDSTEASSTDTVTLPASSDARVYLLRDGRLWPVSRELPASDTEAAAVTELLDGPSAEEESELDATTAIPSDTQIEDIQIADGVASVTVSEDLPTEALAQVVYTLTQFPAVDSVEIDGKRYTRADFEEQTPAILVESPLPFEAVTSPIRATGTANTFEATFNYEVVDADGKVVDENFVTATSGTGTRGTFEFTTGDFDSIGKLVVFEPSAEDGSRTKLVEIPLSSPS